MRCYLHLWIRLWWYFYQQKIMNFAVFHCFAFHALLYGRFPIKHTFQTHPQSPLACPVAHKQHSCCDTDTAEDTATAPEVEHTNTNTELTLCLFLLSLLPAFSLCDHVASSSRVAFLPVLAILAWMALPASVWLKDSELGCSLRRLLWGETYLSAAAPCSSSSWAPKPWGRQGSSTVLATDETKWRSSTSNRTIRVILRSHCKRTETSVKTLWNDTKSKVWE